MCKEHDTETPERRDLPSDGHCAGGTPGGQQGLCVAETRQELESGCAQMETTQMQELGICASLEMSTADRLA